MFEWHGVYCKTWEINLGSGEFRQRTRVLWVTVHESVEDTEVSSWYDHYLGRRGPVDWRMDSMRSIVSWRSPQFRYHGAISDCMHTARVVELLDVDIATREAIILEFLRALRSEDPDALKPVRQKALGLLRQSEKTP